MPPTLLVTGATGNTGAAVINALSDQHIVARAADIDVERLEILFAQRVEPVYLDFTQPGSFDPALTGIHSLFLVRPPHISHMQSTLLPFLDAAERAGVRRVVFLSLIDVDANPRLPHFVVEQHLRRSGMAYTFLRCGFFMQNLSSTHRAEIRDRDEIFVPVGKARTAFIDARDIGAVAALALTAPGDERQAYDLTGSVALDYWQIAETLSQVLRRRITYRNPSLLRYLLVQLRTGKPLPYALVTTWLYGNTRRGMAARVTSEVQRLLGRPPITFRQFAEDHRTAWQRNGAGG